MKTAQKYKRKSRFRQRLSIESSRTVLISRSANWTAGAKDPPSWHRPLGGGRAQFGQTTMLGLDEISWRVLYSSQSVQGMPTLKSGAARWRAWRLTSHG